MKKNSDFYFNKVFKIQDFILMLLLILISISSSIGEEFTLEHSIENYIKYAIKNNPMIHAADKMIDAKMHDKTISKKIPNPSIMGMIMPTNDDSRYGFGKATISQMIPFPSKLTSKSKVAQKSVDVLELSKKHKELILANNVRGAYVNLYTIGKKIEYTKMSLELLVQMESVLLSKYASAMGSQMALLKLQTKMALLENEIINMEEKGKIIRFKMEAMLNTSAARKFPYPDTLKSISIPYEDDKIREVSLLNNPLILHKKEKVNEAKLMEKASKQVYTPNFMVSGSFTRAEFTMGMTSQMGNMSDMKGEWSAGFSLILPIWAKTNNAQISKAQEMLNVEKQMLKHEELNLSKEASIFLAELEDAKRQIKLLDNVLIPKAKQTLELVSEMYKIGQISILDFLDADKMLLDLQIKRIDYVKKREIYAADILITCLGQY